jgi:hypothetical protein
MEAAKKDEGVSVSDECAATPAILIPTELVGARLGGRF